MPWAQKSICSAALENYTEQATDYHSSHITTQQGPLITSKQGAFLTHAGILSSEKRKNVFPNPNHSDKLDMCMMALTVPLIWHPAGGGSY